MRTTGEQHTRGSTQYVPPFQQAKAWAATQGARQKRDVASIERLLLALPQMLLNSVVLRCTESTRERNFGLTSMRFSCRPEEDQVVINGALEW
jgi:hypothetical protein